MTENTPNASEAWLAQELEKELQRLLSSDSPVPWTSAGPTAGAVRDAVKEATKRAMNALDGMANPPMVTIDSSTYDPKTKRATVILTVRRPHSITMSVPIK